MAETKVPNFGMTIANPQAGEAEGWRAWFPREGEEIMVPAENEEEFILVGYPESYLVINYPSHIEYFTFPDKAALRSHCISFGGQGEEFIRWLERKPAFKNRRI